MNADRPETVPRFPLEWPLGWPRTVPGRRQRAAFATKATVDRRVTTTMATQRLETQLDAMGAEGPTLSTNVSLNLRGVPRSESEPADPGAAVYFRFKGRATVFACDRFDRVADNIAALAAHVDALRRVERYGVGTIEQALAGYKALPADSAANWRAVFGFQAGDRPQRAALDSRFRELARDKHPDRGGTDEGMAHLNRARDFALEELG